MTHALRSATLAAIAALAAVAAIIVADLTPPAAAQSEDETTGRIVARLLEDGRVEFGWQPTGGARVLPTQRYFPTDATVDRWLRSSPVEVDDAEIGRINARLLSDGRIEFAFTPTDGERILTDARYFPTSARPNRWLRSTEITIGAPIPFIAVSAHNNFTCAIRENGALECWGSNFRSLLTDAPEGSFTAIDIAHAHACAIRDTGDLACWGDDLRGTVVGGAPFKEAYAAQAGSVIEVGVGSGSSHGIYHTCVIAAMFAGANTAADTGEIECLGSGIGSWVRGNEVPSGRFRAISSAADGVCAIRDTGELACWGSEHQAGVIGGRDHQNNVFSISGPPPGRFRAVSAADVYTCALRESGEIACWGDGLTEYNGVANDESGWSQMGIYAPEGSYSAISASRQRACVINASGEIACWGRIDENWGPDDPNDPNTTTQLYAPEGSYTAVSVGGYHACAIRTSGAIECWGRNDDGQATPPTD